MEAAKPNLFSMMKQRMNYLTDRQHVLSQNIANMDLPGAVAKDVKAPDFGAMVKQATGGTEITRTNPKHMGGAAGGAYHATTKRGSEITPSGNGIVMEEQMMKVAETQAQYQETTAMYKKWMDLMKMATGNKG